jgi:hypothetical protein
MFFSKNRIVLGATFFCPPPVYSSVYFLNKVAIRTGVTSQLKAGGIVFFNPLLSVANQGGGQYVQAPRASLANSLFVATVLTNAEIALRVYLTMMGNAHSRN